MRNAHGPFRLTIVHPCVGRRLGQRPYIRTWQMEPLPAAMLAALTPRDVDVRFHDDRLEAIPYDEPTNLVAISVETYTAHRAYQIASAFRRRRVPVVMGGFHATLCPHEVEQYCESIVLGEAEVLFPELIDDYRAGRPQHVYRARTRPPMTTTPDRSIYGDKRYLPIHLVEFSRGCRFRCEFCAVQSFFHSTQNHRPVDDVVHEVQSLGPPHSMIFFIDDNMTSDADRAKELMRALIPLRIRWVSQASIHAAYDDELLDLMRRSGCQGVLVGFESLSSETLHEMKKGFNLMHGGPGEALARFRRHGLAIYGTFVFGFSRDTVATIRQTVAFAKREGLYIAAFNHVTPFPGTPLFERLREEGRLLQEAWWLDSRYRYNMIPFRPAGMAPSALEHACLQARRTFYAGRSILRRARGANISSAARIRNYVLINLMHQADVDRRSGLPLGDDNCTEPLIKAS